MSTPLSTLSSAELESLRQSTQKSSDESYLQETDQAITGTVPDTMAMGPDHPRQAEFLAMEGEEGLFGGSVGGGKTDALIRWHREGVQYPGYSGLFLRRMHTQMEGSPTTPVERSWAFFKPLGGEWNGTKRFWKFPNGAMVRFGHCQHELSVHNFDGPGFHRITFDQLEQFSPTQYLYLVSRLRRTKGYPIECGTRATANPIGFPWVKQRFISKLAIETLKKFTARDPSPHGMVFDAPCGGGAWFMPSRLADNPALDIGEYIDRMQLRLGAVLAARLANGDWSITEGSLIDPEWLRRYTMRGEHLIPITKAGEHITSIHDIQCQRFATIDTAGTSKHKAEEDRGKPPSWSVCGVWDYWPRLKFLFLRHIWRARVEYMELKREVPKVLDRWRVKLPLIENAHHGQPLAGELGSCARLVNPVIAGMKHAQVGAPLSAKQERAIASGFLGMLERGEFFLPDIATVSGVSEWLPDFEAEILGWTGRKEETADQIDVCSYAADHVRSKGESWGRARNGKAGNVRW